MAITNGGLLSTAGGGAIGGTGSSAVTVDNATWHNGSSLTVSGGLLPLEHLLSRSATAARSQISVLQWQWRRQFRHGNRQRSQLDVG